MRADRDLLLAWDLLPKMDIASMARSRESPDNILSAMVISTVLQTPVAMAEAAWCMIARVVPPPVATLRQ